MNERISENSYDGIKVTVNIPLNVSEDKKQRKINQIYDILTEHNGGDEDKNAGSNAKVSATPEIKTQT